MNRFAELLDRLTYEPARNSKLRLMTEYFRSTGDPERGWALAALTGALSFQHAKPGLIRNLIAERTDPVLFELSYDYVGDLSETVALMWPASPASSPAARAEENELTLTAVIQTLSTLGKAQLPQQLARWLDALDETGRWALIKLVTGGLRVGVSARLAKAAVAALGGKDAQDIELLWPGLAPPYVDLFAWLEGRGEKPASSDPAPFRPPMLAHALDDADLAALDPADFLAEWKWDGIRVQAVSARHDGAKIARLYSRTGEDISKGFPDLIDALHLPGAIDGELLIRRDGLVQSFNVLQQRLNRKTVTPKLIGRISRALARLRSSRRRRGGFARASVCRAARAAGKFRRTARRGAGRSFAARHFRYLGRPGGRPQRPGSGGRRRGRRRGRRHDAQAPRGAVPAGPAEGAVVEVEARSVHYRCGAHVCAARSRQALVVLFRLHIRGVDARGGRR